jgi:hypothetical protein
LNPLQASWGLKGTYPPNPFAQITFNSLSFLFQRGLESNLKNLPYKLLPLCWRPHSLDCQSLGGHLFSSVIVDFKSRLQYMISPLPPHLLLGLDRCGPLDMTRCYGCQLLSTSAIPTMQRQRFFFLNVSLGVVDVMEMDMLDIL